MAATNSILQTAGGNATITNDPSDITMVGTLNSIAQVAGTTGSALITNTDGALISLTNGVTGGGTNLISQIAGVDATITNAPTNTTSPSTITLDGKTNAITQVTTTGNATITNPYGSLIALTGGGTNLISQVAGGSATITNDSPAGLTSKINLVGTTNSILQVAAGGATIGNTNGSLISETGGGTNLISQIVSAGDATITNSNSAKSGTSTITEDGTTNSILQAAADGATITNIDGSDISLTGGRTNLISQIVSAGPATITNTDSAHYGTSTITQAGTTNSILQVAAGGVGVGDALITNHDGSQISQTGGGTNLISQIAGDTATIDNSTDSKTGTSTINLVGTTNSILQAAANGATISNTDGSLISLTGGGTNLISQVVTAGDATVTNSNSDAYGTSTITLVGSTNSILQGRAAMRPLPMSTIR